MHNHLILGNTILLGSQVPSQVLMHSSNALPKARLETISEEHKSSSELESMETNSMSSNLVQPDKRRLEELMASIDLLGNPTIQLLYKYKNE